LNGDPGEPVDPSPEVPGGTGLGRRFFVGGLYVGFGSWVTSVANFAIALVIARLLGPQVFGFYALVSSLDLILGMVGAFSIQLAIVQQPRESDALYDTGMRISVQLAGIGMVLAGVAALVLGQFRGAAAGEALLVLGIARAMQLAAQAPLARLDRQLRFRSVAVVNAISLNLPNFVALALAALGVGVWSLIARDVLVAFFTLALAFGLSGYRYRGRFDRGLASDLMAFGRPMFLSRAAEIVFDRVDRLLVGAWLGDLALGLYHQAKVLAETPHAGMRTLSPLAFNLYSRLQREPRRLARAYGILNFFLLRIVCVGSAVLFVYPTETIRLLLGGEWVAAAPTLRWLALYAGLLPLFENMKTLLQGRGAVWESVVLRAVQIALFVPGIALGIAFDRIEWVGGALLFVTLVGVALARHYNRAVLTSGLERIFAAPALALAAVVLGFAVEPWNLGAALPYWVLPALPALAYALVLIALERGRLLSELRYLRAIAGAAT
jgi:O-antigen/teichoic acid export membrane protein